MYHVDNPYLQFGYFEERQPEQALLRDIAKAVNDEYKAIGYYSKLAQLAPNEQFKQLVLGIRQDEIRHLNAFTRSYFELTGQYPDLRKGTIPGSFEEGVRDAIMDERDTVPFYQNIALRCQNERVQRRFLRAAADEQQHYETLRAIAQQLMS